MATPMEGVGSISGTGRRPRSGRRIAVLGAAALAAGGIQVAAMSAAHATGVTFTATGAAQSYTVPAGVTQISVDATGGQGGGATGGAGGESVSLLTVSPGDVL